MNKHDSPNHKKSPVTKSDSESRIKGSLVGHPLQKSHVSPGSSHVSHRNSQVSPIGPTPSSSSSLSAKHGNKFSSSGFLKKTESSNVSKGSKHVKKIEAVKSDEPAISKEELREVGPAMTALEKRGYHVVQLLGKGGYSKVWKVKKGNKFHAAKVIYIDHTSDNYHAKFLPRELNTLAKINHPNIIRLVEIQQVTKYGFIIIMEFAPGGTLADVLKKEGTLPEARIQFLMVNMFRGVSYLHEQYFAHRDLKLDNVLLSKKGIPKLTDFSYVISCKDTKTGAKVLSQTFCGTEPYLAPEIARNEPYEPIPSDIWSTGVCLYLLMNRRFPFPTEDTDEMLGKMMRREYYSFKERLPGNEISDSAKNLLSQMLDPNPKTRITMKGIMFHRWVTSFKDPSPRHASPDSKQYQDSKQRHDSN